MHLRSSQPAFSTVVGHNTRLPMTPVAVEAPITTSCSLSRFGESQNGNAIAETRPINAPAPAAAYKPMKLTPPFVPGGTVRNVVIKNGGLFDRMPNSEDQVSAVAAQ